MEFERETIAAFDDTGGVQRRPVVVMLMPHQPTEAQFFGQLLGALHAPVAGHFLLSEDLRDFVARLTWSLPLRQPSPVDSPKLRRLLVERTGGITLGICKAFERAAIASIAAIREGREKIDLSSFEDPEIWRGVATPRRTVRAQPRVTMA